MPNISTLWGYITDNFSGTTRNNLREVTKIINILPYQNGGYIETGYDSGIPEVLFEPSRSCILEEYRYVYMDIRWRWGDDGLVAWSIDKWDAVMNVNSKESWVVCYEEEWDLPSAA